MAGRPFETSQNTGGGIQQTPTGNLYPHGQTPTAGGGTVITDNNAAIPPNLEGIFPGVTLASFDPAKWFMSELASYKQVAPKKWGRQYAKFMRNQLGKNFDFAQELGLKEIDTELQGLQHFAPAAAALKRSESAIDNLFNQYQRTAQLDTTMPGMREALAGQTGRAETYASGRLTDPLQDAAAELNVRSRAADNAAVGGFGATSSVARKQSDLMSAEQRLGIATMGEQLLGTNAQLRTAIEMAPTEYSNAGLEMRVMPEVGAGRLAAQAFSETNAMASIPAQVGYSARIQQHQFRTQQEQQNEQFNAQGQSQTSQFNSANALQASMFNAGQANQFALAKFGYQVAQAGAVTGAVQTGINTGLGLQQQQQAQQMFYDALAAGQQSSGITGLLGGGGALMGGAGALIEGVTGLFKSGGGGGGGGIASGVGAAGELVRTAAIDPQSDVGQAIQQADQPSSAAIPKMTTYTRAAAVPQDSIPLQTSGAQMGGMVSAVPRETVAANAAVFTEDTGIRLDPSGRNQAEISKALLSAGSVLNSAGVSYDSVQGQRPIGVNLAGDKMFSSTALMTAPNARAGASIAAGAGAVLGSFGVMDDADYKAINQVGIVASSDRMRERLDLLAAAQDGKGFVGAALGGLGIGKADENVPAAYSAHQLYQVWDRLGPAQKSLALSTLGVQNFKFADGKTAATKVIPTTKGTAYKPMTVGQALGLLRAGYNTKTLADSWETVNDIHAIKSGTPGGITQIADTAQKLGMLGSGVNGAAVPNISAKKLGSLGWKGVPSYGIGAIKAPSGTRIPQGYTQVMSTKDGIVAIPLVNSQTAVAPASGSLAGTLAGINGSSLSAKKIYSSWGKAPEAASKGILGGSAVMAGIYNMSPEEQAALSISSMFKNVGFA